MPKLGTFRILLFETHSTEIETVQAGAELTKEVDKTDHGPKVVSHLLSVLKNSPEEEIPPRMFAAFL